MHLDYAHFSGKGIFMGGTQLQKDGKHHLRTSRSKTHIHIVFPRGWPSCFVLLSLSWQGKGEGHETGFHVFFPLFPAFISWVLLALPGHTGYARVFSGFTLEATHSSPFFYLFDGQFETLRNPEPNRTSDRKNLEGTPPFPPLLNSKDPPLVRKESSPYTPVPPFLSPSASQGRRDWDSGYGYLIPFSLRSGEMDAESGGGG